MRQEQRLQQLDSKVRVMEALLAERQQRVEGLQTQIAALSSEADILEKTEQTLLHISTKVLGQSITSIDKLVTAGLRHVFYDQDLEFRTRIEKYRGKTSVVFELLEGGRPAPILTSYGGGVLALVGVLLRVVTITSLGLRRLLLLDESLAHLSESYHDPASRLLRKLCDELGFAILMVTHQPAFAEHATRHYKAIVKDGATTFKLVQEQEPEHNPVPERVGQ